MYGKIFAQIYDSSIAENYLVRLVFQDLVVLSDSSGAVDMTVSAIARRTNVPLEIVDHALSVLSQPDQSSRSGAEGGRRIVPLDSHRDWGWHIVNYAHYRGVTDEESRRAYFRDRKRQERERKRGTVKTVQDSPGQSRVSTQGEADGNGEAEAKKQASGPATELPDWIDPEAWAGFEEMRRKVKKPLTDRARKIILKKLVEFRSKGHDPTEILDASTEHNWISVFEPKGRHAHGGNGNGAHPRTGAQDRNDRALDTINRMREQRGVRPLDSVGGSAPASVSPSGPAGVSADHHEGVRDSGGTVRPEAPARSNGTAADRTGATILPFTGRTQ